MRICVPVPEEQAAAVSAEPTRRAGAIGVIDNSKPKFGALAQAVLARLALDGFDHDESLYVKKPGPTRPAEPHEIDRLASGAVAVLVGSGD
jgi:hypothetical protein